MRFLRTIMTEYCMAAAQLMLPANRAFNSNGLAVPGAKAYLYTTETTTPQPFYANAGLTASLGSVLTANGAGRFQPAYQDTSIPFRLRLEDADGAELDDIDPFYFGQTAITVNSNFVTPQMYGAVADGVTDDSAAFLAAIAALNETTAYGYSTQTCGTLHIPVGEYYLGTTTLDLTATIIIEGENTGGAGGGASVLRWAAGTTGIRVQRATTTGATGTQASSGHGGDGSIIRNLYLKGGFTSTEAEAHGIHLRATATIRDCFIEYFQGDGIYIKATIGGGVGSEGAANLFHIDKVLVQYCRNGLYVEGADANAGVVSGFCAVACRQWGIWDKSFLGNTYNAPHVAACGRVSWNVASNSPAQPASFASNAGNRFVVIRGQETGAVTNSPPATATNNTYWIYVGAGAADAATGVVAWSSGLLWRAGGGYLIEGLNNATTLLNPYGEIDQYSQFDQNVSIVGNGFLQGHTKVSAGVAATYRLGSFGASLIGTRFYGGVEALGPLNAKDATNQLGPGEGTAAEGSTELRTRNTYHELIAKVYNSSGTATGTIGTITFRDGLGLDYDTTGGAWWHRFKVAASTIGTITASGLDLASGKDLMFNGTTVPIGNTTASKLIGRGSAGAGVAQEITLGTGLSMSGTTLSTSGGLIGRQVFTAGSSGTYTPTSGTTSIVVEVQAAGGGGGGAGASGASTACVGRGGGGGGYAMKRYTSSFSGLSYSVGSKGTGGAAGSNNGTAGGNTTFGAITCNGGSAGAASGAAASYSFVTGTTAGGSASGGDINIEGGASTLGVALGTSSTIRPAGGCSRMSAGGSSGFATSAGAAAGGYGGGGSPGGSINSGGTAAGGDGSDGIIIVWEYA